MMIGSTPWIERLSRSWAVNVGQVYSRIEDEGFEGKILTEGEERLAAVLSVQ